ncbi:hypothetical protein Hanom_Chr02g00127091 [Helianthus anomalus]
MQEKAQTEFTKVQKSITSNSNLVGEVQHLMNRMHYNISRLAKVDPKEIMKAIPIEGSHQEIPKSTPQQSSATPINEARTTVMGPPPNVSKDEMLKRLATSKPQVVTNLKLITSQTVPKPTSSGDIAISKLMNLQIMNEWEQEADSRKPQIVKRKIFETQYVMVREIDKDIMIFPEYNLVKYYWSKEDVPERPPTPYSMAIRAERLERGPRSIHCINENPVKRIMKVDEVEIGTDDIGGTYLQNRYTLLRENGEEEKVADVEIANRLRPFDILFKKDHYEKQKETQKKSEEH